jgi:predicted nucleic acid-binding protein
MKYSLDTNVILSHFKEDRFSDDTDSFFVWIKNEGHEMYISDLVYVELYIGIYLSKDSANEKKQLQRFLAVNNIEGKYTSSKIINDFAHELSEIVLKIGMDALLDLEYLAINENFNLTVTSWAQELIFKVMGVEGEEKQKVCHHYGFLFYSKEDKNIMICPKCDSRIPANKEPDSGDE